MHDAVPVRPTPGLALLAPWQAYALATAATGATLGVRVAFDEVFRGYPGLIIFAAPILLSASLGGLRGGLMATALSCMASQYLLFLPLRSMVVDTSFHRWLQVVLAAGGVVISVLNEALHRARRRSAAAASAQEASYAHLAWEKARLTAAQTVAKLGSWETVVLTGAVTWSDETHHIFETEPKAFAPTHIGFLGRVHPDDRVRVDQAFVRSLVTSAPSSIEHRIVMPDGRVKTVEERWQTYFDPAGNAERVVGTCQDISERKETHEALRRQHALLLEAEGTYRAIFENSTDGIFQNTPEGVLLTANPAMAKMLGFASPEELIRERTDLGRQSYVDPVQREDFRRRLEERGFINGFEYEILRKDGTKMWVCENVRIVRDAAGLAMRYEGSMRDISARRRSEAELRKANNELIEVSRLGGMAEVATDVLHNVGNVLNSINVTAALAVDNVRASRASRLADVVKLLREHRPDLGAYITTDPAGRHIPDLLESLSGEWVDQQRVLATELEELRVNVDLVKRIVASQQARVLASEIIESVAPEDLVEEAVKVQQGVLTDQRVEIVRDYQRVGPIRVAKHKAIQILVALLRNARQASKGLDTKPRITVRIASLGARAAISVTDNGVGIARENLVSIFAPGFTTRPDSRGNGLHASALAAIELGGRLRAQSDGIGEGATFTLELPLRHAVAA